MRGETIGRSGIQHCSGRQSVDVHGEGIVHVERGRGVVENEGSGKVCYYLFPLPLVVG